MTAEKAAEEVKQISLKAAAAACRAAHSLGAADALAIAGLALIGFSAWIRGRVEAKDHLKCES